MTRRLKPWDCWRCGSTENEGELCFGCGFPVEAVGFKEYVDDDDSGVWTVDDDGDDDEDGESEDGDDVW